MKKLCSVLLCAVLICGILTGCPRQEIAQTEPETTAAPTQWVLDMTEEEKIYGGVELTFLAQWEETSAQADVLTQAAEVFEIRTGAQVRMLWPGEGKTEGDILQLTGEELVSRKDQVMDLTQMAEAAGYADNSFSSLTEQVVSRCGHLAGIPQTPYVSGFYYNREAFETSGVVQPPKNWEDFLTVCTMLSSGGWQPLTLENESAGALLLTHLAQYLGTAEAERIAAEGGWKSEDALQASADIFEFVGAGFASMGGNRKLALSNAAIAYGTNTLCAHAEEAALTDLSWGMFPYPGVGGSEPVISADADVLAVSSGCEHPQAAFDFIMLLVTGEFDQLRADLMVGIPADPGNESPIAGAVEALQLAQVVERTEAEWTEDRLAVILKLWSGKYQENDVFSGAMEALYPQT